MSDKIEVCAFCKSLNDVKARLEYYEDKQNTDRNVSYEFKTALLVETSCDGVVDGRISYSPRALNFCPDCGRKIAKEEICW